MAYTVNIPQPNDPISQSQGQILANFQEINTFVNVNHGPFGGATEGKHLVVEMPVQAGDPVTLAGEGSLYTKTGVYSGQPELFWRNQSNGSVEGCTEASIGYQGWTSLPSGVLLKWGRISIAGAIAPEGAVYNVAYPTTGEYKPFTQVYQVLLTMAGGFMFPISGYVEWDTVGSDAATLSVFVYQLNAGGWTNFNLSFLAIGI